MCSKLSSGGMWALPDSGEGVSPTQVVSVLSSGVTPTHIVIFTKKTLMLWVKVMYWCACACVWMVTHLECFNSCTMSPAKN